MVRGLFIAGTGMFTQQRRMDVVTNNITNAETIGFKKDTMVTHSFRDLIIDRIRDPLIDRAGYPNSGNARVGPLNTGIFSDETLISYARGAMEQTNRYTDMAIEGDGFFVVETEDGERYTRAGDFFVNNEGYLLNPDGFYVLGEEGRLQTGRNFTLAVDGTITREDGTEAGSLRIVDFEDRLVLRKQGHNLFYAHEDAPPTEMENPRVIQSMIENSNVDIGREIVDMIEVTRSYEANQRIARMTDESLSRAVNDVGRL